MNRAGFTYFIISDREARRCRQHEMLAWAKIFFSFFGLGSLPHPERFCACAVSRALLARLEKPTKAYIETKYPLTILFCQFQYLCRF
jgi:hypothetical protein